MSDSNREIAQVHRTNGQTDDTTEATNDSARFVGPWYTQAAPTEPQSDYPTPRALNQPPVFEWFEDVPQAQNFAAFGAALAESGDLFRNTPYGSGLLLAMPVPFVPPLQVVEPKKLAAIIADRIEVLVIKKGNITRTHLTSGVLATMLASEAFLQQFRPVDIVDKQSRYLPDFTLTAPGYNDGGRGQRILHIGDEPRVEPQPEKIHQFLGVMEFATDADRTNAVAAALTVMLRNHWPGAKPFLNATSTKSHGGKETIVTFATGSTRQTSVSYERADWALQKAFVAALKLEPEVGVVDLENIRLDRGLTEIRSAFIERFLTDPEPLLYSPGTGPAIRRRNEIVVAMTTNYGTLCEDMHNRGLPIHLCPVGDVASRNSPIGNPKLEFLPAHRDRIEAELRGMIERWRAAGCPLDENVKHPFQEWAQTIGGILMVNGFRNFLGNYGLRKTADDPLRHGLGLLGATKPDIWLPARNWAAQVRALGLVRRVIPEADRDSDKGIERGIGVVFSAHRDETFHVETDDKHMVLQLEKRRKRFVAGSQPETKYRFAVLTEETIGADDE